MENRHGQWVRILPREDVPKELWGKQAVIQQRIKMNEMGTLFCYIFGHGTKMLFENQVKPIQKNEE